MGDEAPPPNFDSLLYKSAPVMSRGKQVFYEKPEKLPSVSYCPLGRLAGYSLSFFQSATTLTGEKLPEKSPVLCIYYSSPLPVCQG